MLSPDTADEIWEVANERLKSPDFSARGMLEKFKVKGLCTTDDPADSTENHENIAKDVGVSAGVYPTFRPDKAWGISDASTFLDWLEKLVEETGKEISTLNDFLECLANRVNHFHEIGARLSDHSFPTFPSEFPSEEEARNIFAKVLNEKNATAEESKKFTGFIMLFLDAYIPQKPGPCRYTWAHSETIPVDYSPNLDQMREPTRSETGTRRKIWVSF